MGGGGGGVGGVSRLRFPPGSHLQSSRFSRHPRLRQAPTRRFEFERLGGFCGEKAHPGPKPPGDLAHRPLGPGSRHSHQLTSCKTSCCVSNPWVRVYHNPQSADLGGRWMVSEGGAVQFHERRGSRHQQAPEPCIPVKNSKNAPVLIGS